MTTSEQTFLRKDSSTFPGEITPTQFTDADDSTKATIAIRDITKRKQVEEALKESEERLYLATRGSRDGLWDWDLRTGAVWYSPQYKHMLGYSDEDMEPNISAWRHLLHPDDRKRVYNEVDEVLNEKLEDGKKMRCGLRVIRFTSEPSLIGHLAASD